MHNCFTYLVRGEQFGYITAVVKETQVARDLCMYLAISVQYCTTWECKITQSTIASQRYCFRSKVRQIPHAPPAKACRGNETPPRRSCNALSHNSQRNESL